MVSECVWPQGIENKINANCLFIKEVNCSITEELPIRISAADYYKIFVNGKSIFFGPSRAARGYGIVNSLKLKLEAGRNIICILVNAYNAATYSNIKQSPYLYIRMGKSGEINEKDFSCYELCERITNVQRYSFQRGFSEYYIFEKDFTLAVEQYLSWGRKLMLSTRTTPKLLEEPFSLKTLDKEQIAVKIGEGIFEIDASAPVWENRSIELVGNKFEGYRKKDLAECVSDTVSRFTYNEKILRSMHFAEGEYAFYDLHREVSGFIVADIEVEEDAELYITFDEMKRSKNRMSINPFRMNCCNVIKYKLAKGSFKIETFEPYGMRYVQINVLSGKIMVKGVSVRLLENDGAYNLKADIKDVVLSKIFLSAANTLSQNSYDLLMDCPTRERACWLNDLYYSQQSAEMFFGNQEVIKASVLNILLDEGLQELPDGMVPMCYPSEHLNGVYIPNCALWFILTVCNLMKKNEFDDYSETAKNKIYRILDFFRSFENEDGLLENLQGWIFVEWSAANRADFVSGVNYPTNMLYCKALAVAAETYADKYLQVKAEKLKNMILKQSFDGVFFQDNRIRENGKLVLKGHISEVCQYFAFFSGVATRESLPELYNVLLNKFGIFRNAEKNYPEIDKANIITGLLMRLDILNANGEYAKVISETKEIFGIMADETLTLWENVTPRGSCNHGISSYVARILACAIIGLKEYRNGNVVFDEDYCRDYDCIFTLPILNKRISVSVNQGKRTIKYFD